VRRSKSPPHQRKPPHPSPSKKRKQLPSQSNHSVTHQPLQRSRNKPPLYQRLQPSPRLLLPKATTCWLKRLKKRNTRTQQLLDLEEPEISPSGPRRLKKLPRPSPSQSPPTLVHLDSTRLPPPKVPSPKFKLKLLLFSLDPTRVPLSVSRMPRDKVSFYPLPPTRASETSRCNSVLSALVV
jgi:hypothetical protein